MKIGLLGSGKTGGEILHLCPKEQVVAFNTSNLMTAEKLSDIDVVIAFVPGDILLQYTPLLIEAKIPVVSGATGFEWPAETRSGVENRGLRWISGSNFSLGMRIVHQMIKKLNHAKKIFEDTSFHIHEVHHTKKLDAPSGTAKSWDSWVDNVSTISHERTGDVVGDHQIDLITEFEKISLRHQALDRKIFAKGALWAAKYLIENSENINPGIHLFEDVTEKIINDQEK